LLHLELQKSSGYVADSYLTKVSCDTASTGNHRINQAGLDLIKVSEGWMSCYYVDVAGYPTIGYGHLIKSGEPYYPGTCISKEEGEKLLLQDIKFAEDCVNKYVTVPLNDNQFSALVDFVYNLGCGAFQSSTLLKKLNAGDYDSVCSELMRWVNAGGKQQPGLVTRRQRECDLFNA
jgi:lysozyme